MLFMMKRIVLVLFMMVAFPVTLVIQMILGMLMGALYAVEDLLVSLQDPNKSRLYKWMDWYDE